ncbi:MAG: flagellar hook-associated protein FlgK [Sedimentisphaerales bacterium]|nr:flagellar hook-associated protein FlgK [Sedimentisphaerales bacterium]
MQNYAIGLSGLSAAQTALDIIGNNIANAATEGYHRQRVELMPSASGEVGQVEIGAGVDVAGVTRMVDELLESEIMRQQSVYGQVSQELSVLSSIETSLGEFSDTGGLNAAIDAFFDALRGLAAHPQERVWQNETINAAQVLVNEFRRLGSLTTGLEGQIVLNAQNTTDSINALVSQIAELNRKIQSIEISREDANNLRDYRDRLIMDLSKLADTETQQREYGVVDVSIGRLPVVTGAVTMALEADLQSDQSLTITVSGSEGVKVDVQGGRLGALLSLKNDLLAGLQTDLDALAKAIVNQVNRYHVQGLGQDGSFTQLSGWAMSGADLSATNPPVSDGVFYLRRIDTASGHVDRYAIDVDMSGPVPDTLESIAAKINEIAGLSASVVSSRLNIVADLGYTFDFLPAVLSEPTATDFTAAVPPTVGISGIYGGSDNQVLTFRVTGSGSVGNGALRLDVTDAHGDMVTSLNIGAGYAAGDPIELSNGIKVSIGSGELNDGDSFEVNALATSDTSGFLAAAGMNAFFSGASASEMRVCSDIANAPGRIATALGCDLTDNTAALKLASLQEEAVASLQGMTPSEYYQRIVANLGQEVSLKQSRQDNVEAMMQNLERRRSEISAVNINDEAAQLLVFEKMFQAMARYLSSVQTIMATVMDMVES